ncbi:hypothetical protein BZL30_2480 [Mycobacterium kansasii]|uniref:Uncharacterized protein n=1 Tax=Mycobacterium kansasii TaxID=1768 RepID=A0A1V3XJX3_MYCKA|nr:hypothetical protein BZL30_2480 [Mycobacterium kansasii]OOK80231.1 hypothetical protein BZL29_2440 [Mycobacterium kansasii]
MKFVAVAVFGGTTCSAGEHGDVDGPGARRGHVHQLHLLSRPARIDAEAGRASTCCAPPSTPRPSTRPGRH